MSSTDSNIFPDAGGPGAARGFRRTLRWLFAGVAIVCSLNPAQALDPNRAIAQYQTDHWDADRGFPGGPIYAIAQTGDGYLWIGSKNGLFRFDGLNFRLFSDASVALTGPVVGLLADSADNLWIRPERPRIVRYWDGAFQDALPDRDERETGTTAMCRGRNGEALFSGHISDTMRYSRGQFRAVTTAPGFPHFLVISIAETPDGDIWMGTRDAGLVSLSKGLLSTVVKGLPNRKINCLLPVGSRDVWVGTDSGVVRWNGMELTLAGVPSALQHTQVLAMIRDRQSNLWIGTASGLCRINSQGISFSDEPHNQPASAITALFEDREGNLWVGGPQGLQRYREYAFLTYRQSYSGGPLYTDAQGRTWFAPSEGGLYWLKGTQIEAINDAGLNADVVYSIAGRSGELWLGRQRKGLTRLHYERGSLQSQTFTEAQGLSQNSVAAVYRSRDGTVWAGTVSGGLSRLNNGKFTTYTTANGLSSNTISAIEEDAGGSMYFATPNGLNVFRDGHWRAYTSNDGLPPASVNCLSEGANALLWIGTGKGLACLSSGRVQVPARMPGLLYEEILGVAEDNGGWLWIATPNHILEVKRAAILRGIVEDADVREFGSADGLRETQTVKRDRSVVRDSLGRIWFSMNRAISVVDPAELASISVPTLVHIRAISGDDRTIKMGASIRIPAGCQRVTFSYAGLNLSAPEQVRFRYKLDGVDGSWSAPTATPEAAYNNLSWGSYRFHVMASNSDGLWNSRPAVVDFEVNPAYWQRWWFWLACLAGFLMSARALFRYRMQHLTRQLNVRFEERLAERTRIAQELHDTLLQGVLSASMQLHVAVDRLPVDSPAKLSFNRVLQLMGQVIDEGRNAIRGLRSSDFGSLNLEDSLLSVRQALDVEDSVGFRVIVEGRPRQLNPILRDEIYRIGREALVNAFRHSGADLVEVELEYAPNSFRMLVRDNGCGIDPTVLRSGREGHWGLSGMRERAEIIGARLNLWSSATAGTEVELVLPQRVAYQPDGSNGSGWRLFGLLRR